MPEHRPGPGGAPALSNLTQRVLTSLVGAALVVGALWLGGWVFGGAMVAVALLAQREVYGLFEARGSQPLAALGMAAGALAVVWPLWPSAAPLAALLALGVLPAVLYRRASDPLGDAAATAFGILYPAALCGSIVALRETAAAWLFVPGALPNAAFWLTTAVLFSIWGADSAAYFAGRAFGRRPLMPRVSPGKTWEGAAGGALGAGLLAAGFKLFALGPVLAWADVGVVALACGIAGPFGDLAESHFKRSAGVKDSATWLPGHGGMLDRIDAALVAAPLVALYLALTKGLG